MYSCTACHTIQHSVHTQMVLYFVKYYHHYTGQRPSWELNSFFASRGIPRNLWNGKVHYSAHNSPPLVPVLSHMDPFDNLSYFFKIHSSVSKRCTKRHSFMYYPKWSKNYIFNHWHETSSDRSRLNMEYKILRVKLTYFVITNTHNRNV